MKIKLTLSFLLLAITFFYSQSEPLNQLDAKGKKNGKWIVWLDKDWKKASDSTTAVYFRYNYFDHGANLYPMGPCGGGGYTLQVVKGGSVKKGNAVLLDGEYNWVNQKGKIRSTHNLQNGMYVSCKEFYSNGQLQTHFDYTKKCEGQPHSSYTHLYDKKGNLKGSFPFCKDEKGGWPKSKGVDG